MPRKSLIDQLGLGDKVIGYYAMGRDAPQFITQIAQEHGGVTLTHDMVERYLKRNAALLDKEKAVSRNNKLEFTVESVRKAIAEASAEAKQMYESYKDDPKAGWAWFKHYLETIDRVAKMVGAFAPDTQINLGVQVNVSSKSVAEQAKEFEGYFRSLESGKSADNHESSAGEIENPHIITTNPPEVKNASTNT